MCSIMLRTFSNSSPMTLKQSVTSLFFEGMRTSTFKHWSSSSVYLKNMSTPSLVYFTSSPFNWNSRTRLNPVLSGRIVSFLGRFKIKPRGPLRSKYPARVSAPASQPGRSQQYRPFSRWSYCPRSLQVASARRQPRPTHLVRNMKGF